MRHVALAGAVAMALLVSASAAAAGGRTRSADHTRGADSRASKSAARGAAATKIARYRVADASGVDLGWTGIAHRQPWSPEQRIEFTLDCREGDACTVGGGNAGTIFGAPVPLSSGGVPVCAVSRLRQPLTGRVNATTGCGELRLALTTTVHTADDVGRPCPRCIGDRVANDGRKGGRCDGGASAGAPCDAHGASALFGATSNDCLPAPNSAVGALAIDLAPLTTGTVELAAEHDCRKPRPGVESRCFCPGQSKANQCDNGSCGDDETCDGPADGVCRGARYRSCELGNGERDCEALAAGAGVCEEHMRRCFGTRITASGKCDAVRPTYVAIFCAPATAAPAINATAGLPGPARLRLALEAVKPAGARAAKTR